ncbi:hypothetical protein V8B97DRAFT_2004188 [Scleroderma yunnanense]
MSLFSRLTRPTQTVGRAYSSFFSSKPGGGRYFNSAKPPKPVVPTGKVDNVNNTVAPAEPNNSSTNDTIKASSEESSSRSSPKFSDTTPHSALGVTGNVLSPSPSVTFFDYLAQAPAHRSVTVKEFTLHQFFSLHRPLLLLSQPTSTIFESIDSSVPLFPTRLDQANAQSASFVTIDDPPESSQEADVDAARQLAHTLVVNRVGATISWQDTLSRLGLAQEGAITDPALIKQAAQKWVNVYADSTRRKKRKKMKKHK